MSLIAQHPEQGATPPGRALFWLCVCCALVVATGCAASEEYERPQAMADEEVTAAETSTWQQALSGVWFVDFETSRRLQANRRDAELLRDLSREGSWRWVFLEDGSFESRLTVPGRREIDEHGNWSLLRASDDVADVELRIEGEGEVWRFLLQGEDAVAMYAPEGNTLLLRRDDADREQEMGEAAARSLAEDLLRGRWRADAEALAAAGLIHAESSRPDAYFELEFTADRRFYLYLQLRQADMSESGGWRVIRMQGREVSLELISEGDSRRETLRFPDSDTLLLMDNGQELRFERVE